MSIWSRFTRFVRSIFGGAVSAMENPRLILEQNMREINDQIPEMNQNVAEVLANVKQLEKERDNLKANIDKLTRTIKAAIQQDKEAIARQKALKLEREKEALQQTENMLEHAHRALEKAKRVRKAFLRERKKKIQEAEEALRAHERAQWQSKIADTMEQFEVTGFDQTHDEMIGRLNKETAKSEARMEVAMDSIDADEMQLEQDAEEMRAAELVNQFKMEMGMTESETSSEEGELEDLLDDEELEEPSKTIGKQRTRSE